MNALSQKYVTTKKLSEITGYTRDAISSKTKKGIWIKDVHFHKAPDGRLMMNVEAIYQWIQGEGNVSKKS